MAENQGQDEQREPSSSHPSASRRLRLAKIGRDFLHVPIRIGTEQASAIETVREASMRLALLIEERCPHGAEKVLAIRSVQVANFWAAHAISHRETDGG